MKEPKRTELVGIRLTEEEFQKLKFAAKISAKTPSGVAYELLKNALQG